jgi:hypothetical protein
MRHIKKQRREAKRKGLPDVWAMGYENPVEQAAIRATTSLATTMPATAAASAAVSSAAGHAATVSSVAAPASAGAQAVHTVAPADREPGLRVTKGASTAAGVYRSNTEKGAGPNGPCAAR